MSQDLIQYQDDYLQLDLFPQGKIFRLTFDPAVNMLKILSCSRTAFSELRNAFSSPNPGAFFSRQYGYKSEPLLYQINQYGYFSSGLIFEILEWIKTNYGSLNLIAITNKCRMYLDDYLTPLKGYLLKYNQANLDVSNVADDLGKNAQFRREGKPTLDYRDYQKNSVKALIFKGLGRGLIEIPTAGGKSFILANFIWNIHKLIDSNFRYLILVPTKQLVSQFYTDLISYGIDKSWVTKFTAGLKSNEKFNPQSKIIIANRQYLYKNENLLPKIDVLIVDEVHTAAADASKTFIERLNCKIKVGCSGTLNGLQPRQKWQIMGLFGRIIYTEEIVKLQKEGFISKLKITVLDIVDPIVEKDKTLLFHKNSTVKYKADDFSGNGIMFNDSYLAEEKWFADNYLRLYKPVLEYCSTLTGNIIVLFDKIEIGNSIAELSKTVLSNKQVFYIDGSTKVDYRETVRSQLESIDNGILFGQSAVMSTGINIKKLSHIVFLFNSKAYSRVLQSIGRTLRLHSSKSEAHLVDIVYNFKYSYNHFKDRMAIYKKEYCKSKPDEVKRIVLPS